MNFLRIIFIVLGAFSFYGAAATFTNDILSRVGLSGYIASAYATGAILFFTIAYLLGVVKNNRAEIESLQGKILSVESKANKTWSVSVSKKPCSNCGEQIDGDAASCPKCGQRQ